MPLYEYVCPSCGKTFEELKSFEEAEDKAKCPNCGAMASREVADIGAVIYKGSGYYCKDHPHGECPHQSAGCCHGGK